MTEEQRLKQILAQVIEANSGDESITEQDIETLFNNKLFNNKFEETDITESRETWQQLDKILRERSYREFIKPKSGSDNTVYYTAGVSNVIWNNIHKYDPSYTFIRPSEAQSLQSEAQSLQSK